MIVRITIPTGQSIVEYTVGETHTLSGKEVATITHEPGYTDFSGKHIAGCYGIKDKAGKTLAIISDDCPVIVDYK